LAEQGLGDLAAPAPRLLPDAAEALHCWQWCGGWAPERLPLYAALNAVPSWALLLELLEHLRAELAKTK
jgi:hypothetical protein